jgi:peptidoglycan/LPS O-acetylase OafA/YrhL
LTSKFRSNHEFPGLDALRGAAALIVAMGHAVVLFGFRPGSNYLAVDLFFVLSGFVLAHAYDQKIARGMGTIDFMRIRLIRLYPIYCLGTLISTFAILIAFVGTKGTTWHLSNLAAAFPLAIAFLPTPPGLAPGEFIYPLDAPAWSLAFELVVNLAFVVVWRMLSIRRLILIVALSGIALIFSAYHYGDLAAGSGWRTLLGGFPRVFFSFPLGVLMLRCYREGKLRLQGSPLVPLAIMLAVLIFEPSARFRPAYDLVCVIVVFPLVVAAGATVKPLRFGAPFAVLGALSYGLYALHFPLLKMTINVLTKLTHGNLASCQPWAGLVFISIALTAAYVADIWIDTPLRRWLSKTIPTLAKRSV